MKISAAFGQALLKATLGPQRRKQWLDSSGLKMGWEMAGMPGLISDGGARVTPSCLQPRMPLLNVCFTHHANHFLCIMLIKKNLEDVLNKGGSPLALCRFAGRNSWPSEEWRRAPSAEKTQTVEDCDLVRNDVN